MANLIKITSPLDNKVISQLHSGDMVLITGKILTDRDAAHKRLYELLINNKELPVDLKGQIIYYVGPTPAKPGEVIGSAGPTTSGRMDIYTPHLIKKGLKGMIGKGSRSEEVIEAIKKYKAVYFGATGGAGALLSKKIIKSKVIAYEDLGPEAIYELYVQDFPTIVINDCYGNDLYKTGILKYKKL